MKNTATRPGPRIPERFANAVNAHLVGNHLDIEGFPAIMWIVGEPGMGKTWQLREQLRETGHSAVSVSAADLESDLAGVPAKTAREAYLQACRQGASGRPSALVIDDVDTTLGDWEGFTGTVNHQGLLAFFMHVADGPHLSGEAAGLRRAPVFFTGNDAGRLYAPLSRTGRMHVFRWDPTAEEKAEVVAGIFAAQGNVEGIARALVSAYPDRPVSFFAHLQAAALVDLVGRGVSRATIAMLFGQDGRAYAEALRQEIGARRSEVDWLAVARQVAASEDAASGARRRA